MGNFIIYATKNDVDTIRRWINDERDIAWIVKVAENDDHTCYWKAVERIDTLEEQAYALWHVGTHSLKIPSGDRNVPDAIVADPFVGWFQNMGSAGATTPWFGSNLPGPYVFRFKESGREAPGSLGRSDFSWEGDYFRIIGKPAHPEGRRWWARLRRFLQTSATRVPWTAAPNGKRTLLAYEFPEAHSQIRHGRPRDINP